MRNMAPPCSSMSGEGAFVATAERIQELELMTEGAVVKGDPS
jgi:hypothetical protein